jgi:hypothetical protein
MIGAKYPRSAGLSRRRPFVGILVSDIVESGETVDFDELVREPLLPPFDSRT